VPHPGDQPVQFVETTPLDRIILGTRLGIVEAVPHDDQVRIDFVLQLDQQVPFSDRGPTLKPEIEDLDRLAGNGFSQHCLEQIGVTLGRYEPRTPSQGIAQDQDAEQTLGFGRFVVLFPETVAIILDTVSPGPVDAVVESRVE